jgi:flagellar basal-body rod protein FlgF
MLKGLFQAAAGMKTRLAAQDIIANNLANAGTAGFQRAIASVQSRLISVPNPTVGPAGTPPPAPYSFEFAETNCTPDRHQGTLQRTGVDADLALEGDGYLVVQTDRGERLTRGGPLHVDAQGRLTTLNGEPLLSTDGNPIQVGAADWHVAQDGTVTAGGSALGRLRVVSVDGTIEREGGALLAGGDLREVKDGSVRVMQGYLEHSNVEAVREMVDMIAGVRAYEASQRAVVAQDHTLQTLFDAVQKV